MSIYKFSLGADGQEIGSSGDVYGICRATVEARTRKLIQRQIRLVFLLHDRRDSSVADLGDVDALAPWGGTGGLIRNPLQIKLGDEKILFPAVGLEHQIVCRRPFGNAALLVFDVAAKELLADGGAEFKNWTMPDVDPAGEHGGRERIDTKIQIDEEASRPALGFTPYKHNGGLRRVTMTRRFTEAPLFDVIINAQTMPRLTMSPPSLELFGTPYGGNVTATSKFVDGLFFRHRAHLWTFEDPDQELEQLLSVVPHWIDEADNNRAWRGDLSGDPVESLDLKGSFAPVPPRPAPGA
jgi:hypothetical protein